MAQTPKPKRKQRKRDWMLGSKPCGDCYCCPCNEIGCAWCPSDGRRAKETIPQYKRRWIEDRYPGEYPGLSDRKRKAGRKSVKSV